MKKLFELGEVVATKAVLDAILNNNMSVIGILNRHIVGDWGDIGQHDKIINDRACETGESIHSIYNLRDTNKVWVVTNSSRTNTTILLQGEY